MPLPDENWPRWIAASVANHFSTFVGGLGLPLLVEGSDDREAETLRARSHVELRLHGPETKEISHGYFQLFIEINLLLTEFISGTRNVYDFVQHCGQIQKSASGVIPVYRYGLDSGGVDDGTHVGCFHPDPNRNEAVTVFHFGEIDRVRHVRQSAVDGRYRMFLYN